MSATRIAIDETEVDADGVVALLTYTVGTEDRDRLDVALLPYRTGSAVLAVARAPQRPLGVIGYSAAPDRTTLLHPPHRPPLPATRHRHSPHPLGTRTPRRHPGLPRLWLTPDAMKGRGLRSSRVPGECWEYSLPNEKGGP
ncbi:hypothetical protein [Rhodococcus sp. ACPA1]|uniref:hypothetical protein n=1 Tax=Rhodococcus sp. ACPA1 TaxID=2028572 RepID=UPI00211C0BC6|nr:hypothetical protein [Rhodococcus sp. ACPA1]